MDPLSATHPRCPSSRCVDDRGCLCQVRSGQHQDGAGIPSSSSVTSSLSQVEQDVIALFSLEHVLMEGHCYEEVGVAEVEEE